MGCRASIEDIQFFGKKEKKSVQEQLQCHWNNNKHVKNMFPSIPSAQNNDKLDFDKVQLPIKKKKRRNNQI